MVFFAPLQRVLPEEVVGQLLRLRVPPEERQALSAGDLELPGGGGDGERAVQVEQRLPMLSGAEGRVRLGLEAVQGLQVGQLLLDGRVRRLDLAGLLQGLSGGAGVAHAQAALGHSDVPEGGRGRKLKKLTSQPISLA